MNWKLNELSGDTVQQQHPFCRQGAAVREDLQQPFFFEIRNGAGKLGLEVDIELFFKGIDGNPLGLP